MFLSKVERNYLLSAASLQICDGYSRTINSRLKKKVERFASQQLPLLIDKGGFHQVYLTPVSLQISVTAADGVYVRPSCVYELLLLLEEQLQLPPMMLKYIL